VLAVGYLSFADDKPLKLSISKAVKSAIL